MVVPGAPRTPNEPGVPVVTSGGRWLSLIHHARYSALTQKRPGGPQTSQPHAGAHVPVAQPPEAQPGPEQLGPALGIMDGATAAPGSEARINGWLGLEIRIGG